MHAAKIVDSQICAETDPIRAGIDWVVDESLTSDIPTIAVIQEERPWMTIRQLYKYMKDGVTHARVACTPGSTDASENIMQTDAIRRPLAVDMMGLSMPLHALRTMELRPGESASIAALVDERAGATMGETPSTNDLLHAVTALISAVNCALSGESQNARQFLNAACQSLEAEPECSAVKSPVGPPSRNSCRGGLAPWQIRCVSTHIEGHLSESIQCEDLSNLVNLSLSHFMRAFRDSFGCPPHAYLVRRRMERAQGLMLTTDAPLGQIALECGLADQSHLSRLFQRFLGESPAAWRRARTTAANGHR